MKHLRNIKVIDKNYKEPTTRYKFKLKDHVKVDSAIKLVKNKIYKITDRYKDGNINNYKLDDGFWEYESNLIPLTREEKLAIKFNI